MEFLEKKIDLLKKILNDSHYTVMLGGSGMMKEGGYQGLKSPEQAYVTEKKYGLSPEDIFTTVFLQQSHRTIFQFLPHRDIRKYSSDHRVCLCGSQNGSGGKTPVYY